jgi:hypothetical protein
MIRWTSKLPIRDLSDGFFVTVRCDRAAGEQGGLDGMASSNHGWVLSICVICTEKFGTRRAVRHACQIAAVPAYFAAAFALASASRSVFLRRLACFLALSLPLQCPIGL